MSAGVLSKYFVPPRRMSAVRSRSRVETGEVALLVEEPAQHEPRPDEEHH
jgi:hypothetical protein